MNAIGGYFELELRNGKDYHIDALSLNTGRNALEYVIRANNYEKIYLPYYSCDVLLQPLKKLNIQYEFYLLDENFEARFNFDSLGKSDAFLYVNYFGLKGAYAKSLKSKCTNLIIDNAQAFFDLPIPDVDTIYSARKFFGVPDGAYLYCKSDAAIEIKETFSYQRFEQLLQRIDLCAEDGYKSFVASENALSNLPLGQMSKLTKRILQSVDYSHISFIRRLNYQYLHNALGRINRIQFDLNDVQVPMVYPFLSDSQDLRQKLIDKRIYVAQYWPNVLEWCPKESVEYKFTTGLLSLPIDQRLQLKELDEIIRIVLS